MNNETTTYGCWIITEANSEFDMTIANTSQEEIHETPTDFLADLHTHLGNIDAGYEVHKTTWKGETAYRIIGTIDKEFEIDLTAFWADAVPA